MLFSDLHPIFLTRFVTLEIKGLCELVQHFQEEVIVLSEQVPNGLLAESWAVPQKTGYLNGLRLLIYQMNALQQIIMMSTLTTSLLA